MVCSLGNEPVSDDVALESCGALYRYLAEVSYFIAFYVISPLSQIEDRRNTIWLLWCDSIAEIDGSLHCELR